MLRRCLARWKEARQVMLRQNYLNKIAIAHLASKLVQHWAKWAYWSRRELGKRIVAVVEQRRQRKLLQCVGHWKELVHARHKRLWSKYFSLWKMAIQVQHRDHHLLALRHLIHFRWRWQCWRLLVQGSKHIQAIAEAAKKLREQRLLRHSFVSVWLRKVCRYKLGSKILGAFAKRQVLIWAIKRWRKKQLQLSAQALANAFRRKKLQSYYLHLLFLETVGHYRIAVAYERRHRLVCTWASWNQYFKLKRRRYEAEAYFRHRSKLKAVQILHVATINAARRRNQHLDAKAWFEAVLLQSVFSHWFEAAKHVRWCRSLGKYLAWHTVGQRAFGEWQNACMERQNLRLAEQFYSSTLVTQSWNALLRVTKRRQVALAMWNHAMIRVRLTHAVSGWKDFVAERRGQFAVATTMNRMQQLRMRQQLFNAWALVATARRLALRREQRESLKWKQTCWTHWKLWRVSCRWHRSQHLLLLRNTFALGLKRHAIQQQACREVYMRTARHLLHRSLFRWRVEWWLICNHKRLCAEIKSKALSHWKAFVAACRQKRRWEHYVQQLHRVQTRSSAVAPYAKYRVGGTFRDTRALQAQLKRNRVLMTHVLHAWYLVVQNRRRRTQLAMSKKSRRRQDPQSNSKARQIALEFWARRVIQRCFFIWREQSAGSRRAEVQCKVAFRWSKVSNG
ncbi:unnamed protein product [Phytophthora lilii]|uniref:Unnamed protein product n=1 Tax=Phytophthora lilii TaxID=2077276 RepID=A0A9W6TNZ7_9STRA|nr:unnamed protein product [Phytophthora lilii]